MSRCGSIMLDELNKFCPSHGRSPLRDLLVDIAERGRSMGVLLFGAEQYAGQCGADGHPQRRR